MDRWEEYDLLVFEERCYEYDKLSVIKIIIQKSKLTLNQIRIHNEEAFDSSNPNGRKYRQIRFAQISVLS